MHQKCLHIHWNALEGLSVTSDTILKRCHHHFVDGVWELNIFFPLHLIWIKYLCIITFICWCYRLYTEACMHLYKKKRLFHFVCLRQPFHNLSINQNQCFACDFSLSFYMFVSCRGWGQKLTVQSREKLWFETFLLFFFSLILSLRFVCLHK